MLAEAQEMGFLIFAIHRLQPKPKSWDLKKLREFTDSQTTYILDPYLGPNVLSYINGECDSITGFKITADIVASRQAKLQQLGLQPTLPPHPSDPLPGPSEPLAKPNPPPLCRSNTSTSEPKKLPEKPDYEINNRTGLVKTLND